MLVLPVPSHRPSRLYHGGHLYRSPGLSFAYSCTFSSCCVRPAQGDTNQPPVLRHACYSARNAAQRTRPRFPKPLDMTRITNARGVSKQTVAVSMNTENMCRTWSHNCASRLLRSLSGPCRGRSYNASLTMCCMDGTCGSTVYQCDTVGVAYLLRRSFAAFGWLESRLPSAPEVAMSRVEPELKVEVEAQASATAHTTQRKLD